jgi:hypothetical protein
MPIERNQAVPVVGTRQQAATRSGLARFDGVRFTVFNRYNTPAMLSEDCRALARISHRVLNLAKPRSSKEAPRRARKAKPRPGRERNAGDKGSAHKRTFPQERILVFPRLGAVLPQPGFLIHLPGGEKSV